MTTGIARHSHRFVAFEGGDGAGKTTLRKRIYQALRAIEAPVLSLIPMSWLIPECTRLITYAKYHGHVTPNAEITRAYVRDKEELSRRLVVPHLAWRHILVDRHAVSDIVYHEVLYGTPAAVTHAAYAASGIVWPDIIVYVDTPPEVAEERMRVRHPEQRNHWETLDKQRRVHDCFEDVFLGGRLAISSDVIRVRNTGSPDDTFHEVRDALLPRMVGAGEAAASS